MNKRREKRSNEIEYHCIVYYGENILKFFFKNNLVFCLYLIKNCI